MTCQHHMLVMAGTVASLSTLQSHQSLVWGVRCLIPAVLLTVLLGTLSGIWCGNLTLDVVGSTVVDYACRFC